MRDGKGHSKVAKKGYGLGTVIAVAASWSVNKSILWAVVHGMFSWVYVVYYVIAH